MAKTPKGPAWGYRLENGKLVSRVFDDGNLPKGWADTPSKAK